MKPIPLFVIRLPVIFILGALFLDVSVNRGQIIRCAEAAPAAGKPEQAAKSVTKSEAPDPKSPPEEGKTESPDQETSDTTEATKPASPPSVSSILGEQAALPTLNELELPPSGRLLQGPEFSWIVLITDKVLVVDPILPRPDTLRKLEEEYQRIHRLPVPKRDEHPEEYEQLQQQRRDARFLNIVLQEGDELEFRLDRRFIKEIIHYEDLILRRVDRLLEEIKPGEAYELLESVYDRDPNWPGIVSRQEQLLMTEALLREKNGEVEDGLGFLERLHQRRPDFPRIEETIVRFVETLLERSVKDEDYRRARFFLSRLRKLYPNQSATQRWTEELSGLASRDLEASQSQEQKGELLQAVQLAERALKVWPDLPRLRGHFERLHNRYQRISVGVLSLTPLDAVRRLFSTPAEVRVRMLTQVPFFHAERLDGATLRYRSRILDEWEPTDLGRSLIFHPQYRRRAWESLPQFSSAKLVEQLLQRIDKTSPFYDERLDYLIESVEFRSPLEFGVRFSQVPLNPAALLRFDAIPADRPTGTFRLTPREGSRFTLTQSRDREQDFVRIISEPLSSGDRHVAHITERLYPTPEAGVQGLLRGEVDLLTEVRPLDVNPLGKKPDVFVLSYVIPGTHLIQFHPRSKISGSRAFRRALTLSLDRGGLLKSIITGDSALQFARLTTAPYPKLNPGYQSSALPNPGDQRLALALALAAKKDVGGELPTLKLVIADSPLFPDLIPELISSWKRCGIEVELVSSDCLTEDSISADAPPWDMVYRIAHLSDPLVDLWPFLTFEDRPTVASLSTLPNWLRQKLLLLDQVGDFETANQRLRELHQLLWAEAELIPLWEVDEFVAARKHLRGIPEQPMYFYQNVEQWRSLPWIPPEVE